MPEQEPSFEERLAAFRLSVEQYDQASNPLAILDEARDLISAMPNRPRNLLNDFMAQRTDMIKLWQRAGEDEEQKQIVKKRIKVSLDNLLRATGRQSPEITNPRIVPKEPQE